MERVERKCLQCGHPLKGRIDKKFCDDACRNAYNNNRNGKHNEMVRRVNNILARNRRILASLIPTDQSTNRVSRYLLLYSGFDFIFHTHRYINPRGKEYCFCYDYGYRILDPEWVLVIKAQNDALLIPDKYV